MEEAAMSEKDPEKLKALYEEYRQDYCKKRASE